MREKGRKGRPTMLQTFSGRCKTWHLQKRKNNGRRCCKGPTAGKTRKISRFEPACPKAAPLGAREQQQIQLELLLPRRRNVNKKNPPASHTSVSSAVGLHSLIGGAFVCASHVFVGVVSFVFCFALDAKAFSTNGCGAGWQFFLHVL